MTRIPGDIGAETTAPRARLPLWPACIKSSLDFHHAVLWLRGTPHEAAEPIRGRARALAPPHAGFLLGYAGLEPKQIRAGIARLSQATNLCRDLGFC